MAKFNDAMRTHVAGSMSDRTPAGTHSDTPRFPGNRSDTERQGDGRKRLDGAAVIRLDRIVSDPLQPRTEFDQEALAMLAESIKSRGVLQPIRTRWDAAQDRYVVVVGDRRFRAAGIAGIEAIPCVVVSGDPSPDDLLEDQLVENALRLDLSPIEAARAYRRLIDARGFSVRQLADRIQVGHASIVKTLALLDLPAEIQEEVDAGNIAPTTGYQLSKITDRGEQAELARAASEGRLRRDDLQGQISRRTSKAKTGTKGRGGKAKALPTKLTFRTPSGVKIVAERSKGIDQATMLAALEQVAAEVRKKLGGEGESAEAT